MEIKMKKIVVFLLFLLVFGTLSAWDEFNQYSIADELKKPGVKLVAVDFYATWCTPCIAAIPKWKKLQEKYGDKGFKLIVVSVQSEGSCSQPPQWNPDRIVCDYDGNIADAWHAHNLPQAFLWSWQGNLLVAHGGVDNVAAAIEKYFKKIPRVYVESGDDENIYKMVRSELIKNSKIEVVASDEERKALAELRKKSKNLNYDENLKCNLGKEISANSRLVISQQKRGKNDALLLELFSAETGCLTASGAATIRDNPEQEVAEAVDNLLKNLLGDVKMPDKDEKSAGLQKQATQSSNFQDTVACEYAKSEAKDFAWKAYLKDYPNGKCAGEAKNELDKNACKKAEQKNSVDGWKEYLKEFHDGKCAAKAKDELDKRSCKTAEKEDSVKDWKAYLEEFPEGKCATKAKSELDKRSCKTAEKKDSVKGWKAYLEEFPEGKCATKAKSELDKRSCETAEKKNTIDKWQEYLKEFPDGKCKFKAQTTIQKLEARKLEKTDKKQLENETYQPYKAAGISLMVVGAAVAVGGIAGFHVASDKEYDKYKNSDASSAFLQGLSESEFIELANKHRKKSNTYRYLEITSGSVGGTLLITGIILTFIKKEKPYSIIYFDPEKEGFYASLGLEF